MIDAHLGVLNRCCRFGRAAQGFAVAVGVPVNQKLHHVGDVLLRAAQPILHGQKVRAHVLRGARNEAQHLRNAAQHFHLRGTTGAGLFLGAAAQFFQQRHRPAGGFAHVELTQLGELDHLTGRHHANHRVAGVTARLQRGQDGQKVVFQKHGGGDDDVALFDVGNAARSGFDVAGVFRRGVQREVQPGQVAQQRGTRAVGRAGQVRVHRDQHDPDQRRHGRGLLNVRLFNERSVLWRHTKSRW